MTKTCTFELQINFETNQARDGCLSTIMILSCPEDIICIYNICWIISIILLFYKVLKEIRYDNMMKKVVGSGRCRSIDQGG